MNSLPAFLLITLFTASFLHADESDKAMPDIVRAAESKVSVLMRHIKSTDQCFPDPDAVVRFEDGRVILEDFKRYQNLEPRLEDGLVSFQLKGKWGACDQDGKVVLAATFESSVTFHEGLAGVSEGDKYGFIDKQGKWVIKPIFDTDYTWFFIGEVCPVYLGKKGAVINKKGEYIWQPGLLRSEILGGGIFIQTADGQEGFLDDAGKLIPDGQPNKSYYHADVIEAANATGKPLVIPPEKSAQAAMVSDIISAAKFDESDETIAAKMQTLINAGVDVNVRDESGKTPLLMAADRFLKTAKVFKILLDAGADVNAQDNDGRTALHKILHWADLDLDAVRLLLDRGISVLATDKDGDPAFVYVLGALDEEPEPNEENNSQLQVAKLLLAAGAGKWKDYMSAPIKVVPSLPQSTDPIVAKLTDPAQRDEAFRTILSWQKYRSEPSAPDRIFKPLRHVVVCPQIEGPPLHAVFPMVSYEQRALPKGHIMLIDADGAIIPYYINANSIDDHSEFKDINGDGIIEEISTISFSKAQILHILPMTREQNPTLNIVLKQSSFTETEWSWQVTQTNEPSISTIELGPLDKETKKLIPKVQYNWSKEKSDYIGPAGGGALPYMRLDAADPFESKEFDAFVDKKEK